MNMKTKIATAAVAAIAMAQCAFAGLQLTLQTKETVSNNVPIVVGATFNEDDPIFTNWAGSAEFQQIPRITSESYETEYVEDGETKTNKSQRTKFYCGGTVSGDTVVKEDLVLDMYSDKTNVVIATPGGEVRCYNTEYTDTLLGNKVDKVDLSAINELSTDASSADVVNAMQALVTALGLAQ